MLKISNLIKFQQKIAKKVILKDDFNEINYIAGADVAFDKNYAYAAIVVFDFKELIVVDFATARCRIPFPYIPTFLSFREAKPIMMAYQKLRIKPDIILCDGQGIAHPRRAGIAVILGVNLNIPSIGVGKSRLCGNGQEPNKKKGSFSFLFYEGEKVGIILRTRTGVKPLFVSPGHKISILSAKKIVMACVKNYRVPEPLRYAHILSMLSMNKSYRNIKGLFPRLGVSDKLLIY
ncbi:MAG: deoxyribonuclease V [candidate division WOR-3 bacterium]|nr:deoxyribonuclease V [candidate division WOR-3 bacterium]